MEVGTAQREPSGLPPWLLVVMPGLIMSFLALRVIEPIKDPDTYWHIASGDHLRQTWDFVLDDPFGASAEKPWILNQWLPQLAMSFADQVAGLAGVVWLTVLGTLGVLAALYVSCRRRSSPLVATLVVAVAFLATSGSIAPRPQLVTFAMTAVATDAWLRTAEDRKPRWWLIPLTWVWACSHGMWFMGIAVGLATIAGLLVSRRVAPREAARLGIIPVGSLAAAALTPVGPVLLWSPFQVSGVTAYITEWQPPSPTSPTLLAALGLILLVVVDAVRNAEGRVVHVLLLTALALVLAVTYITHSRSRCRHRRSPQRGGGDAAPPTTQGQRLRLGEAGHSRLGSCRPCPRSRHRAGRCGQAWPWGQRSGREDRGPAGRHSDLQ